MSTAVAEPESGKSVFVNKNKANTSLDATKLETEKLKHNVPFVTITLDESPKLRNKNKLEEDFKNEPNGNLSDIKAENDEDS